MTYDPTFKPGPKERRFMDALRDLFVGAEIKGKSGYINLMRIKSKWFREAVEPTLFEEITIGLRGENLADDEVLNHASFQRRQDVLLPGANVRLFGSIKLN